MKKKFKLSDLYKEEDLKLKELMETHGGLDEDEDCYCEWCVASSLFCVSSTMECWFSY